ncbi:MAG: NAD(P)H-dependent oxidoreductase [Akkermansiaceae bacterium]
MNSITNQELNQALNWRYATKVFDASKKIDSETFDALLQSLRLSPSSFGLQPWKFFVVENTDLRQQLRAHSWNQPQVTDASHLIVLCAKEAISQEDIEEWIRCLAITQSTPIDQLAPLQGMIQQFTGAMSPSDMQNWNTRQVYLALGQLMASAAFLGIDTCPLEGISPAAYDQVLGLEKSGYRTRVACALGYRSEQDKYATAPKARFALEKVVTRL